MRFMSFIKASYRPQRHFLETFYNSCNNWSAAGGHSD
uniref:Uncharacterized protein n=1 Tax=Parascaris equorum TaxID=6256 RepID=A0A914S323_PAREQ